MDDSQDDAIEAPQRGDLQDEDGRSDTGNNRNERNSDRIPAKPDQSNR